MNKPQLTATRTGITAEFPPVSGHAGYTRHYEWHSMQSLADDIRRWWSRLDNAAVYEALEKRPVTVCPTRGVPRRTRAQRAQMTSAQEAAVEDILAALGL